MCEWRDIFFLGGNSVCSLILIMVEICILEPIRNVVGRLVLGGVFLLVIWLWAGKHEHNNRRSSNCHSHQTRNRGTARASIYSVDNVILTKCFPTLLGCMCSLLCKLTWLCSVEKTLTALIILFYISHSLHFIIWQSCILALYFRHAVITVLNHTCC